mgnify:CR=1 FL=1
MSKRESYGPQQSPFKIFLYIVVIVLLLGGIAYLVKCTRVKQAAFQEQLQELGAQETEFVQPKKTVTETSEAKNTEKTQATESATEQKDTAETESNAEMESESETAKAENTDKGRHILLLNGSGKDGVAAKWKETLTKTGYTNVSVASFPGSAIEKTRIYVEKEEEAEADEVKDLFSGVEITTDAFTAEITLEDGSTPKDVDLYIIIGKNDAA